MSGRKEYRVDVEHQEMWTIPKFAAVLGYDSPNPVYDRLVWDDDYTGTVHLPGGVNVEVSRDGANGNAVVYRQDWLKAFAKRPRMPVVRLQQVEP